MMARHGAVSARADSLHAHREGAPLTTSSLPSFVPAQRIGSPAIHLSKERRLTMFALVCLAFFTTCGGAYGLEPLIGAVGPGWAVVLIVVTPFVWSLPTALMVAELATLIPEEGGYYVWVRETLGPFWAVQEAWWTIGYSIALLAIFPVLFVSYLTYFLPALSPSAGVQTGGMVVVRWLVTVVFIVTAMAVNLRGARDVGRSAKISALFVLGAFATMILLWLKRGPGPGTAMDIVVRDLGANHKGALLLGLSIIVYNYSGWDNVSTYAAEVDQPRRNYPRAIAAALVLALLSYLLPVIAGLSITTNPEIWTSETGWPLIAQIISGRWLGSLIAAGGLVSMWGLFNAQLLYVSRLPLVMAWDGWLPARFRKTASETAVPKLAIVCLCGITALFSSLSYGGLAVIQCILYAAALTLEFLALIKLRLRHRENTGSFQIPGRWLGMAYVCVAPCVFAAVVLYATLRDWRFYTGQLLVVAAIIVSGLILYVIRSEKTQEACRCKP